MKGGYRNRRESQKGNWLSKADELSLAKRKSPGGGDF